MYKIIFTIAFLLIMSCSSKHIIMNIKCDNIERVLVTDLVTGKKGVLIMFFNYVLYSILICLQLRKSCLNLRLYILFHFYMKVKNG